MSKDGYAPPEFEGRVVFFCHHLSPLRKSIGDDIKDSLTNPPARLVEAWPKHLDNLITLVPITDDIEFHFKGDETDVLLGLERFWKHWKAKDLTPENLWILWLDISLKVIDAWQMAFEQEIMPFAKKAHLPGNLLSKQDLEELADPESPLQQNGASSVIQSAGN